MDGSPVRQKTYAVNKAYQPIEAYGAEITVYGVITMLNCNENQLTKLDLSKINTLTSLSCYGNKLTKLDLSKINTLTSLICGSNQLTSLDLRNNVLIKTLDCSGNKFTDLDLSKNVAITTFYCDRNNLITTLPIASEYDNASISTILAKIITNATSTTGTLNIYGGDNTTVHTAATTKGWTVNVNL